MRRLHTQLECPFRQRWRGRHDANGRQHHMRCYEHKKGRCGLRGQRGIDGRMRMVSCVAVCAGHTGRGESSRAADVTVRVVVCARDTVRVEMRGGSVCLGFVLMRVAVRQRRGWRREPRG